jgi:YesN/AraC family two-component response regulator
MYAGITIQLTAYERKQVEKVKAYIDEHLKEELHTEDMALQWDVSVYKLKAGFMQLYGKSFSVYLKEQRMERGKELLLKSNKIIYEIAMECGYSHVAGFYKAFRKMFGKTPDDFRKG